MCTCLLSFSFLGWACPYAPKRHPFFHAYFSAGERCRLTPPAHAGVWFVHFRQPNQETMPIRSLFFSLQTIIFLVTCPSCIGQEDAISARNLLKCASWWCLGWLINWLLIFLEARFICSKNICFLLCRLIIPISFCLKTLEKYRT